MEILRKDTVSLNCGRCAFPQSFHNRKLGELTVFYAEHRVHSMLKIINCENKSMIYVNFVQIGTSLTPKFLKYVWPFFNIMREVVNQYSHHHVETT